MTLSIGVTDDQLGQYLRRTLAITDRLGKSLPFDSVMDALQDIHDGKFKILQAVIPSEPVQKFALLADLGIITVPADYDHASQLDAFMKKNRKKFYSVNENITDANFPNPSRILKPGDRLWVRAHKQVVSGTTTSEERMAFLATLNSHHTGAQGVSLVFEQKRDQLPKGYWYLSFDEKKRLWEDAERSHRVPEVDVGSDGDFDFDLGYFEEPWDGLDVVLSFCDVPSSGT